MPRHSVINARNVTPFKRYTISATPDRYKAVRDVARRLSVSQGSVIDVALGMLADRDDHEIIDLLTAAGHLTDREHDEVMDRIKRRDPP